jgi:predicted O-methyltransferase YrrM
MDNLKARYEYLVDLINANGYKKVVELGIEAGATTIVILDQCKLDEYIGVDIQKAHNFHLDIFYKYPSFKFLHCSSHEASLIIPDKSRDLVYIDASHNYEDVKQDIEDWLPKIREGGIICGHDYSEHFYPSVIQAVKEKFPEGVNLLLESFSYGLEKPDNYIWWRFV